MWGPAESAPGLLLRLLRMDEISLVLVALHTASGLQWQKKVAPALPLQDPSVLEPPNQPSHSLS